MSEYLIVDGYNVINAWPEFAALKDRELGHARDVLTDILASYGAYKNQKVVLVFDAVYSAGNGSTIIVSPECEVIFTNEGETADSRIEKMVYSLVRQGESVYVVTSDWAEQIAVLSFGACRISAREFRLDVRSANQAMREKFQENAITYRRQELETRLSDSVREKLDKLRRDR